MYKFGQNSLNQLNTVDKNLQLVAHRALRKSARRKDGGVDFAIPEFGGKRTAEDQNGLFKKGFTKADGYEKQSYHQTGMALDIIPYVTHEKVKGNAIYTKHISAQARKLYFHIIAACVFEAANEMSIKVTWGGNWKTFEDLPHYQIPRNPIK